MDFWHCDEDGVYDNEIYNYRGHQFTDASGGYRLLTARGNIPPARSISISKCKAQGPSGSPPKSIFRIGPKRISWIGSIGMTC